MPRRRSRSSGSPSSASSAPRSVSIGEGTKEDSGIEPATRPLKRHPAVAVATLAAAVAAGVLVLLRTGPVSDSVTGLHVARTQEGPPDAAHGQPRVMTGKPSLDASLRDHSVVELAEDVIQSINDAVQAGVQMEKSVASSPDFFFPRGAPGVDTQSDYTRPSEEPLAGATEMRTGSALAHRSGEMPDRVIEPTCATGAMSWMHLERQTPVAEEPTDPAGSTSAALDGRVLSLPAGIHSTMSAGQATGAAGTLAQCTAATVKTASLVLETLGVQEEVAPTAGVADKEVRAGQSAGPVLFYDLATTVTTDMCPAEVIDPQLRMCSKAPFQAVTATGGSLNADSTPPNALPENSIFPASDVVAVQKKRVAVVSAATAAFSSPNEPAEGLVSAVLPVSLTEEVAATTTTDSPCGSPTPGATALSLAVEAVEHFSSPVLRESPLEQRGVITRASLSSATKTDHVPERTIEESTTSVAGMEMFPTRPALESIDYRPRAQAEMEPNIGMLKCVATFPDIISAWTEAKTMTAPSYYAEDVRTAAVTAKNEHPVESLPSCAVANWRSFVSSVHPSEDPAPSLLAPGHEAITPIMDLGGASLEIPPPPTAAVSEVLPAEAEGSEQSTRCLSPQEDNLAAALSGGGEGTVQEKAALEAPLLSATAIPEHNRTEAEALGEPKRPLPTQEDKKTAAVKRGDLESTEGEVVLEAHRISVTALVGTEPTEIEEAGEPARCPRVLEVPFSFATAFPEGAPTEVEAGEQSTCPLPVLGEEPAATVMGQDKGMRSDEVVVKSLLPSAAWMPESTSAGAEARGVLTQLLPAQDEPTGTKKGEGRVSSLALPSCPANLLTAIFAERDTKAVYPSSSPGEYGPRATVEGDIEVATVVDALLYGARATDDISTRKVDAETMPTTLVLAEGGPNADTSASDKVLETLSCPAGVPLAVLFGETEVQKDLCPLLLADTPEATGVHTDGVSLFGTLPPWAVGLPATNSVKGDVGRASASCLSSEGATTTVQARGDAGLVEGAATTAGTLRFQTDPAAVGRSSSFHGTGQEKEMSESRLRACSAARRVEDTKVTVEVARNDGTQEDESCAPDWMLFASKTESESSSSVLLTEAVQSPLEYVETSSIAAVANETGGKEENDVLHHGIDALEALTDMVEPKCKINEQGLEDDQLRLEMLVRDFNSWIRSMTFPVRKVEAGVVANGMRAGLMATETLADGEPYLLVPESITLDASKAREDPELGPPLAGIRAHLSPIGLWDDELDSLRVLLIAETFARADRSFWAPYVRLLPTLSDVMSYHPLFFDDAAIASLEGSDVQASLRQRRHSEAEAFNSKFVDDVSAVLELEEVLGAGWITLERYLWATAILDSRMIWWDGRKHLVPLLDLVNNAQGPPGTLVQETVQDAKGNAVATTTRSFETGTQVLENYGHANHVLFLYHGFSLGRENRHDCVWIAPKRLPRGPGHSLMLASMQEAFPGGRPSFCISLDKHGPYDFVSYVRIAAGLPAFPSPPPVGGEPCSSRGVDGPSCQWAAEGGFVEPGVHERWENLRHDPEGLAAVVVYLEARLSKYPRSLVGGSDGEGGACSDGDGGSCGGSGGRTAAEKGGDACGAVALEEETRKFLDSEQHLLQEILDYLVAFTPHSSSSEREHQKDKVVMNKGVLTGNHSQEDTAGDANKRSGYDDGNSQAGTAGDVNQRSGYDEGNQAGPVS